MNKKSKLYSNAYTINYQVSLQSVSCLYLVRCEKIKVYISRELKCHLDNNLMSYKLDLLTSRSISRC